MKIKIFILFAFLIILFAPMYGLVNEVNYSRPFALFLSTVVPGMGQIYSGDISKGLSIWIGLNLVGGMFWLSVGELNFEPGLPRALPVSYRIRSNLTSREIWWGIGLGFTYLVVYFYNLYDIAYGNYPVKIDYSKGKIGLKYNLRF